ncbi:MAG TPA: hypothetical protein VK821_10925 [Dehalococcoidia bacterium]|nr:hypothetical protein [Dehalococcoidia bacterium]
MTLVQETSGRGAVGAWKAFWTVAALYDMLLGAGFFFLFGPIFRLLGIAPPNNTSYIHLTAAFVFVQGAGYWIVRNKLSGAVDIVKLGILYKAIYSAVAAY